MNQDQVKQKLLQLDSKVDDFSVIFSGKSSRKVNGLYYPEKKEILIHNKNFTDDNALMYTAIHEFAHHVQFINSPKPVTSRAHTGFFWNIFHRLLERAEKLKIYVSVFGTDPRFIELTTQIKERFMTGNGELMKEFGRLLLRAYDLCRETNASPDDYFDRVIGLHRTAAHTIMKITSLDIRPEIGYENMKTVARIKDPEERKLAEAAFIEGHSPDMVKTSFISKESPSRKSEIERLMEEKDRIEKNLDRLTARLAKIERMIQELKHE